MNSSGKLQVDEWADDPCAMRVHKRIRWLGISPAFFGALGTLFLHALIIQWLPLSGLRTHKNVELSLPTVSAAPASKPDISLVIVNLISASASAPIAVSVMTRSELAKSSIIVTPDHELAMQPLLLPLNETEGPASATGGGGDVGEQARLYGIYTGQIRARIERAWRRPRSAVSAVVSDDPSGPESFRCRVQIVQDARGNVVEILLIACNGSSVWQQSLMAAIRQASPLPAPPSTSVFSESIALDFVGLPFTQSSNEDEYQLVPRAIAQSTSLLPR
jgi:hypothetical protein